MKRPPKPITIQLQVHKATKKLQKESSYRKVQKDTESYNWHTEKYRKYRKPIDKNEIEYSIQLPFHKHTESH